MADIFLSYAHQDLERARSVAEALTSEGWAVFWDRRIPPGRTFEDYIEQRVRECRVLVVLWSPHAAASKWVRIEAAIGRERDILIPVLIAPAAIPFGYGHLHAADLTAWRPDAQALEFEELVSSIESLAPRTPHTSARSDEPPAAAALSAAEVESTDRAGPAREASTKPSPSPKVVTVPAPVLSTNGAGHPRRQHADGLLEDRDFVKHRRRRWTAAVIRLAVLAVLAITLAILYRVISGPPSVQGPSSSDTRLPIGRPDTIAPSATPTATPPSGGRSVGAVTQPSSSAEGRGLTPGTSETTANRRPPPGAKPSFRSDAWNLPDEPWLGFVEVPAGPFRMGSDKSDKNGASYNEWWTKAGDQGRLALPAFYLGRYEVTVAQFQAYSNARNILPGDARTVQGPRDHPVRYVSWGEAIAYCEWLDAELKESPKTPAGLRDLLRQGWHVGLPSEAEWEKAARGTEGRIYPWGNEAQTSRAPYGQSGTTPVGSYPAGASPYGFLDLSGNVWEWTRSLSKDYPYDPMDGREDLKATGRRVVRGGSFNNIERDVRSAARVGDYPGTRSYAIGFRIVISRY